MPHIITTGASVITPSALTEYESSRETRTRVHDVINREMPDATLRVARARSGRMTLAFTGPTAESDSATAEAILAGPSTFTLTSDEATIQMTFVLPETGRLNRTLALAGSVWRIAFDWQEVGT